MFTITRREFLAIGAKVAALTGLGATAMPQIVQALQTLASGQAPVIWLQGQSCSGCSVSILNADHPDPATLLTRYIALQFHGTLSTATGKLGMQVLNASIDKGGYILVVEGAVPAGMPEACVVGHEPFVQQLKRAAQGAIAIVAVGSCACFGGIPAAENNPTGASSVPGYLSSHGVTQPVIAIPGCPVHPDWLVGTLVHVLQFGIPKLNSNGSPEVFFKRLIHDQCPRFADYEREHFAQYFSDDGCFFKLGCLGPVTYADCPTRLWNSGTNFCINAGSPCIGCSSKVFAQKQSLPFFRKVEHAQKQVPDA